jgi:hypothetical protein
LHFALLVLAGAGAILSAMAAHPDTAQILQEGTRALEKHCPRAVAKITRLCGDIACLLPPATWTTGPDQGTMQAGRKDHIMWNLTKDKKHQDHQAS